MALALATVVTPRALGGAAPLLPSFTGLDAAVAARASEESPAGTRTRPTHKVPDHSFADVDRWVQVFDDPDRDAWQQPGKVVESLGVGPGSVVADIGAGTGYFSIHLARAVAPGGKVLAIDTEANMVAHIRERADEAGVEGVEAILADPDDPRIPARSADRILLVDTYHHIHDRVAYLRRLREALAHGGQVVVIDFFKKPLPVGPPVEHKMARQHVVDEFVEAGYRLASEETFLPYQYFLRFEPGE